MKVKIFLIALFCSWLSSKMLAQPPCKTYACYLCEWGGEFKVVVPTIFTPNGDFVNDVWAPIVSNEFCLSGYKVDVYNRWGIHVFESFVSSVGWNGKSAFGGDPYEEGTYFYIMSFSNRNTGESKTLKGSFQLLR